MKRTIVFISIIFVLLVTGGCGLIPGGAGNDLRGTSWTLESYGGKSLLDKSRMTATFESGEISGSASCNHYFGSYQAKGNQITINGLGWTEMACMDPEGIMEQESTIMSMLSKAVNYSIEGGKLQFQIEGGEMLVFSPLENID